MSQPQTKAQRWGPECYGCKLYRKKLKPWPKVRANDVVLVYPSMPSDDWEAKSVDWPMAESVESAELAPMLRCPGYINPDDLARRFRGEKYLQAQLQKCQMGAIASAPKAVCLGEQAFKSFVAERMAMHSRKKLKFTEMWGSVLDVPRDDGTHQEVYVASRWYRKDCPREMRAVDFQRIGLWLSGRLVQPTPVEYEVLTPKEGYQYLKSLKPSEIVSADIETGPGYADASDSRPRPEEIKDSGLRPYSGHLRCIGFGRKGKWYLVPEFSMTGERLHSKKHMTRFLTRLCEQPTVWHNAGFDLWWLSQAYGIVPTGRVEDTMLLHRHIYEECPHSLAVACSLEWYTGSWKAGLAHGLEARDDAELWQYCVQDVYNTYRLYRTLVRKFKERY